MTIDTFEISIEQANQILQSHEGHFHELKSKEIKPAKLTQTLSAFANTDGGEVYIGIREKRLKNNTKKRIWDGFTDIEETNGFLQTIQEFFSFQQYLTIAFLKNDVFNGFVLHVQIYKTKGILYASDRTPYVRRGAQNIPIRSHEDLQKLEYDKGITSYEKQTLNYPSEIVSKSKCINKFIEDVIPTTEPEAWLKKQLLIQNNKPTVAAFILFSDEPQSALPKQSGIKLFRYITSDDEGSRQTLAFDPITIEGPAYYQIKQAVDKTTSVVENIKFLGDKGFHKIEYPQETIHEIITNAVLHRDYSKKADIKIVVFDNRIEIQSPGKLPGHITVKNILEEQLARNGAIVRFINKFPNPPNKDVGEGLNTAFTAMKKLRLKEPLIIETDSSVVVKIFHEPLASPEEIVIKYLDSHEEVSNSIARKLCGIDSENEMKRVFQKLQYSNLLERTPDKKGSASTWRKPVVKPKQDGQQIKLFDDYGNPNQ